MIASSTINPKHIQVPCSRSILTDPFPKQTADFPVLTLRLNRSSTQPDQTQPIPIIQAPATKWSSSSLPSHLIVQVAGNPNRRIKPKVNNHEIKSPLHFLEKHPSSPRTSKSSTHIFFAPIDLRSVTALLAHDSCSDGKSACSFCRFRYRDL